MDNFYGVARLRALETYLLSADQINRLAQAADFEAAFSVLSETKYAEHLHNIKQAFGYEELYDLERSSLKNLLNTLAPGNEIINALYLQYDYLNAKLFLKNEAPEKISSLGNFDPEKIRKYAREGIKDLADHNLVAAIGQAKSNHEIDLTLDQYYYQFIKKLFSKSPSPLIRLYAQAKTDLTNLKTILRCQLIGKKPESFLLEPALIDHELLESIIAKKPAEIINRLYHLPYFPFISAGLEDFAKLEKNLDDYILASFKKAKYMCSGLEPIIAYYLAKENEINTLRFILICKRNFVASDKIKERVRLIY